MADKPLLKRAEPVPPEEQLTRNIMGPLRPTQKPEARGDLNLLCAHCGALLVEGVNEQALSDFGGIQCYVCGEWNTGRPELAER